MTTETIVHLIVSIAHVSAWVARTTNHRVGTIIGLDPASESIFFVHSLTQLLLPK
jgi:hypothetical protein